MMQAGVIQTTTAAMSPSSDNTDSDVVQVSAQTVLKVEFMQQHKSYNGRTATV